MQPATVRFESFEGAAPPEVWAAATTLFTAAYTAGAMAGFALSHGVVDDLAWQRILVEAIPSDASGTDFHAQPENLVVIQELAVAAGHRGQGIARECVRLLLAGRQESHVVLGVHGQADDAFTMYLKWGFSRLGQTTDPDTGITVRVLGSPLPWPAPQEAGTPLRAGF